MNGAIDQESERPDPARSLSARLRQMAVGLTALTAMGLAYPLATPDTPMLAGLTAGMLGLLIARDLAFDLGVKAIVILSGIVFAVVLPSPLWSGLVPCGLLALAAKDASSNRSASYARLALAAGTFWLLLLFDWTGLLWGETSRFAWWSSARLTALGPQIEHLGPGQLGLQWLAACLCVWAAQIGSASWVWLIRVLATILAAAAVSIAFRQPMLIAGVLALVLFAGRFDRPLPRLRPARLVVAGVLAVVGGSACLALISGQPSSRPTKTIGVLNAGLMSLELPKETDLARNDRSAEFGGMTRLLAAHDWAVERIPKDFSGPNLDALAAFVVINPNETFSESQLQAVENYVRSGGRLLVLGDHTDLGGMMGPLNSLIGFTSIRYRFDSAIPEDRPLWKWKNCIRSAPHAAFIGRRNETLGISVGASLEVGARARVLVQGEHGFSDIGRPDFGESRLGDMQYLPGELRGGLALVAEERAGAGVVQVWGDTAGFQSSSLVNTSEFIAACLSDLTARVPSPLPRVPTAAGALAALLASVLLAARSPGGTMVVAALLASGFTGFAPRATAVDRASPDTAELVYVDRSHAPRFPTAQPEKSFMRLADTVLAGGSLLVSTDDLGAAASARPRALVIAAPTRAYSESDAAAVQAYVSSGGHLLVAAGHPDRAAVQPVLKRFGLDIDSRVFGPAHNARVTNSEWRETLLGIKSSRAEARFAAPDAGVHESGAVETFFAYDADIQFRESFPVTGPGEVLAECWGKPIVIRARHGSGTVVLIGDGRFLNNENLEIGSGANASPNLRNLWFVLRCLGF